MYGSNEEEKRNLIKVIRAMNDFFLDRHPIKNELAIKMQMPRIGQKAIPPWFRHTKCWMLKDALISSMKKKELRTTKNSLLIQIELKENQIHKKLFMIKNYSEFNQYN